mgnify:CR=1 FL=1|jgi:hypothetical protein
MNIINKISLILFGILLGFSLGISIKPNLKFQNYQVMITCGGGDFTKEAFQEVNSEIMFEVHKLINEQESEIQISVTPELSGYSVNIAASEHSSIWDEKIGKTLDIWINKQLSKSLIKTKTEPEDQL